MDCPKNRNQSGTKCRHVYVKLVSPSDHWHLYNYIQLQFVLEAHSKVELRMLPCASRPSSTETMLAAARIACSTRLWDESVPDHARRYRTHLLRFDNFPNTTKTFFGSKRLARQRNIAHLIDYDGSSLFVGRACSWQPALVHSWRKKKRRGCHSPV